MGVSDGTGDGLFDVFWGFGETILEYEQVRRGITSEIEMSKLFFTKTFSRLNQLSRLTPGRSPSRRLPK